MQLKPKKAFIQVPGHGVVSRETFTDKHLKALLERAEKNSVNKEAFLKQYFNVDIDFSTIAHALDDDAELEKQIKEESEGKKKK